MNKLRKILSYLLVFVLMMNLFTLSISAEENTDYNLKSNKGSVYFSAKTKTNFKNTKDKEYNTKLKGGKIKKANTKKIEELMLEEISSVYADKKAIYSSLESYGCYVLNPSSEELITFSSSSDVTVSTPTIYYNAYNKTWTVTCGGYWKNMNWEKDKALPGNVGGQDAFGIGYTSVTGTYKSSVVSVSGYINDGRIKKSVSTSNRSDGDGSKGFGFRLQDYVYADSGTLFIYYVGYQFGGLCNYDSNFSSFGAVATGYYIHTWDKATINSITFGVNGKTAGVSASIANSSYSWPAYGSDSRFGL